MSAERGIGSGASLRDAAAASRAGDRRAMYTIAAQQVMFGLVPIAVLVALLVDSSHLAIGVDFQHGYWPGAHRLLNGLSPYSFTPAQIKASNAFVYRR